MIWRVMWKVIGWCTIIAIGAGVIGIGAALYAYLPRPLPANEVIGHWEAEPGKHGTADFYADGTFKMEGLSMDIINSREAFGRVYARGTWELFENSPDISLRFTEYEERGNQYANNEHLPGIIQDTRGWGKHRQLYFSDRNDANPYRLHRVSDEPEGTPRRGRPGTRTRRRVPATMIWRVIWKVIGWSTIIAIGAGVIGIAVVLFVQAPRPLPASEVVGHWEAEPGRRGTADFYADGTFRMNGLSMDITSGHDVANSVYARGTWTVRENSPNLSMRFLVYEDRERITARHDPLGGRTELTLGWGKHRQLYFADGEEINQFRMNRVSDEPDSFPVVSTSLWNGLALPGRGQLVGRPGHPDPDSPVRV